MTDPVAGLPAVVRAALARLLIDPGLARELADPERRGPLIAELGLAGVPEAELRGLIVARGGADPGTPEEAGA
ncbi:hypothetical protein [Micromonospora profundi]|uniref:hypothetical protein n=1 Tax=Micromonospora TaxID=1873 RepID=UPI00143A9D1B|nr:hypothetical protein [Micromonospora profundi]NJC12931.1 hypothetical protein [Micromonospora profundi]